MKKVIITLILLIMFISLNIPVNAESEIIDNVLVVDYDKKEIKLKPGEEGTISLTIRNIRNESIYIDLEFIFVESPGSPRGKFSSENFLLNNNESKRVKLIVHSYSEYHQIPDISRFVVTIYWSTNLTGAPTGSFDIGFKIVDDYSELDTLILIIPTIILLIIILVLYFWRKKNKNREKES